MSSDSTNNPAASETDSTHAGRKFIPSFISTNTFLAIIGPYLAILVSYLGYNSAETGILMGIFEGAGIVCPFILGYMADKTGNYRSSLIISCVVPALVAFPLVMFIHPVLTAVFLFFIGFGIRSLVSLIDAATTIHIGTSGNYGKIRLWGSIGFIIMTLFYQWTPFLKPDTSQNISLWIFITSSVCLIPILLIPYSALGVSDVNAKEKPAKKSVEDSAEKSKEKFALEFPPVSFAFVFCGFAIIFLSRFGMSAISTFFSLYVIEVVDWDAVGLMWSIAAMAEVPFLFLGKLLIRRFGSMSLLAISAAGVCLRLLILAFLPFKSWVVVSSLLHSICFGIYHPASIHFITKVFQIKERGRGMSMLMIMGTALPSIIGSLAGGMIVQSFGYKALFISYAVISGIAVIIFAVYKLKSRIKKPSRN